MKFDLRLNRSFSRGVLRPGDHRLWFFCRSIALQISLGTVNRWSFEVFHRRLVLVLATFAILLWIGASAGLYYWLNRTPHNQVAWRDLAAPWHWSELKTKRGDTAILNAIDDLKNKNFSSGFYGLRVGLARSPGNVTGRTTLMRLLRPANPVQAVKIAEEGLEYSSGDPAFLAELFRLYNDLQIRTRALEIIATLLKDPGVAQSKECRFILTRARVGILIKLERFDEAVAAIAEVNPSTPEERAGVHAMHVEALAQGGHLAQARELASTFPDSAALGLRQQVEMAVALEDSAALQTALRRLRAEASDEPAVYLISFQSWVRLKRATFREQVETEFFTLFASKESALQAISALAVTLEIPEVVTRAQLVAQSNRIGVFAFRAHKTELALRRGDIELAMRSMRDWEARIDAVNPQQRFYPEFIKILTRAAFANASEQTVQLTSYVAANGNRLGLNPLIMAAQVMERAGNLPAASQVVQTALSFYPYSDPLLVAKGRIDVRLPAPATAVEGRENERPVTVAVMLPDNETDALRQFDEFLRDDKLSSARDLLRAIRAQKPAWLAANEGEVGLREVELAFVTVDRISSRAAVRSYLARERNEAAGLRLVALAGRLRDAKRVADALLIRDEVLADQSTTEAVRTDLQKLNLADDFTELAATETGALAAIDASIKNRDWASAERWLKYLRDKPPEWAVAASVELKVREVKIRFGLDQRPVALNVFRDLVLKAGASRDAGLALVRELARDGEEKSALILAREAARLIPGEAVATDLLKEIEALATATP